MSGMGKSGFPTTHWTSVEHAGNGNASSSQALARLLDRYMAPLRTHLIAQKGLPPDRAADLLQSFIAEKVLERNLVGDAVREKGRFRTFLLIALDRFVSNQLRNEQSKRRRPEKLVAWDDTVDPADAAPEPHEAYDIAWARQVLADAADRMKRECETGGRADIWAVFEGRVLHPTLFGGEPASYSALVEKLRIPSVEVAANLLITAKRMFARSLRGVVGEYSDGGAIEREIAALREILARAGAK